MLLPCLLHVLLPRHLRFLGAGFHLSYLSQFRGPAQIAFITIDPDRDTPGVLRDYMSAFGPNYLGLTGKPDAIRKAARTFKVFFQKIPLADGDYTMDHSAVV